MWNQFPDMIDLYQGYAITEKYTKMTNIRYQKFYLTYCRWDKKEELSLIVRCNTPKGTHTARAEGVSKAKPGRRERTCEGAIHRWLAGGAGSSPAASEHPAPLVIFTWAAGQGAAGCGLQHAGTPQQTCKEAIANPHKLNAGNKLHSNPKKYEQGHNSSCIA